VAQEVLHELPQALEPGWGGQRGLDHQLVEQGARGIDRRELELFLRPEMGEEAALAHPDGVCEPADRQPADALDGRELRSFVEDRRAAPPDVASTFAQRASRFGLECFAHRLTS
jgi:hypothetical protein